SKPPGQGGCAARAGLLPLGPPAEQSSRDPTLALTPPPVNHQNCLLAMRNLPNLACQDLQRAREASCRARTLSTQLLAAQLAAPDEQLGAALSEVRQTMD